MRPRREGSTKGWTMRGNGRRIAIALLLVIPLLAVASMSTNSSAAPSPTVRVEPPVGAANGSDTVTGSGFTSGQPVTVKNETTSTAVCSTDAATDGTFSCSGPAEATPGTASTIGVGTATGFYQTVGAGQIATVVGGGTGDGQRSTDASLTSPQAVASDAAGDVYYDEDGGSAVRRIDAATGVITTVAGQTWGPNATAGF